MIQFSIANPGTAAITNKVVALPLLPISCVSCSFSYKAVDPGACSAIGKQLQLYFMPARQEEIDYQYLLISCLVVCPIAQLRLSTISHSGCTNCRQILIGFKPLFINVDAERVPH